MRVRGHWRQPLMVTAVAAAIALAGLGGAALAQDAANTTDAGAAATAPQQPEAGRSDSPRRGGPNREGARDFREFRQFEQWQQWRAFQHWQHRRTGFGPGRGMRGRMGRVARGFMLDGPILASFRELDLSDAQRQQLRMILMNARQNAQQARGRTATGNGRGGAGTQFGALRDPGSPNYASALQAAKERAEARIQQASDLQQRLYRVLTPQQKTRLTQILAQRQARMQQMRARFRSRGERAPGGPAPEDQAGQPGA